MNRLYYELIVNLYMKVDVDKRFANEKTSRFVNHAMNQKPILKELHQSNRRFKGFGLSTPYPIESDGIYKANEIYKILIRSYNSELIYSMKEAFYCLQNEDFVVVGVEVKSYNHRNIDKIYNITPAVATITVGGRVTSWTPEYGMEHIENAIFNNLIKKYNYLNNTEFSFKKEDIFSYIKLKNSIAIPMSYKNGTVTGYKYEIGLKDNPIAMELGNFATVYGLLSKNTSLACGFTQAKYTSR